MRLVSRLMTGAGLLALSTGYAAAAPAVVASPVNLRTGPGIEFPVIAAMPAGTAIDVVGCGAEWCRVAFAGNVGFASRPFLGLGSAAIAPLEVAPAYGTVGVAPAYGTVAVAPAYEDYGYESPGYAYEAEYGYAPGYRYGTYGGDYVGYGTTYQGYRGSHQRGTTVGAATSVNESVRTNGRVRTNETVGVRTNESVGVRTNGRVRTNETVGVRTNERVRTNESVRTNVRVNENERRAAEINGNNPMINGKGNAAASANVNESRPSAQRSTTRRERSTTGAAPRGTQGGY